jgi:hypothetical protein
MRSPDEKKIRERKVMLHFDNAPSRNAEGVQKHMMSLESKGLEHSLYSLDLVRCDFFLMQ